MRRRNSRVAEWMPALLAAAGVPLLAGMVYVFVKEAGFVLVSSYGHRALRRSGLSVTGRDLEYLGDILRWALPLLSTCLTGLVAYRVHTRQKRSARSAWVFAAVSALSLLVLGLIFGFRFSLSLRRWSMSLWYSLCVPLTFAAAVGGGQLGRRRRERREELSRILDGSGAGREGVRTALGDCARFASVPAIHALLDGRTAFVSTPRLARHRTVLEAAGSLVAGLSPRAASDASAPIGVRRLPPDIHRLLAPVGIRSLACLSLAGSDPAASDFAVLYFTRPAFLVGDQWQFGFIAAQLALRLENTRLLEIARRSAVLEERQRLAREIHDTIAQDLIGIVVNLEEFERSGGDGLAGNLEPVHEAVRTARRGLQETRRLVWALRPMALEQNPLPAALSRRLHEWSSQSGVEGELAVEGEPYRLQPDAEITFFRMLQESCSNIARHARARHAWVRLRFAPGEVVLSIRDDGVGLPEGLGAAGGVGLAAMRERIESLGGALTVHSDAGTGTELSAVIPGVALSGPEAEDEADSGPDRR